MQLPISVKPDSDQPEFYWTQVVDTPVGRETMDRRGYFPDIEVALVKLINIATELVAENARLRGQIVMAQEQRERNQPKKVKV